MGFSGFSNNARVQNRPDITTFSSLLGVFYVNFKGYGPCFGCCCGCGGWWCRHQHLQKRVGRKLPGQMIITPLSLQELWFDNYHLDHHHQLNHHHHDHPHLHPPRSWWCIRSLTWCNCCTSLWSCNWYIPQLHRTAIDISIQCTGSTLYGNWYIHLLC